MIRQKHQRALLLGLEAFDATEYRLRAAGGQGGEEDHLVAAHRSGAAGQLPPLENLARISHHLPTEARDRPASTSLRLLAVLNVLSSTPALVKRRAPRTDAPLTHFAAPSGEKCGLVGGSLPPSGHEENAALPQLSEPLVVGVAAVENHDRAGVKRHLASRRQVGCGAVGDDAEAGQIAVVIEHQM